MFEDFEMQNDLSCPLRRLRDDGNAGLVRQMIEIQKHRSDNEKSSQWHRSTKYIASSNAAKHYINGSRRNGTAIKHSDRLLVRQRSENASFTKSVLSVSYTWLESDFVDEKTPTFEIVEQGHSDRTDSRVRDSVVLRALNYVLKNDLPGYWTDKDCMDENEKEAAIQSMDLMYRFGDHPVAFLSIPIRKNYHARLLSKLMLDKWIWQKGPISRIKLKKYVRSWHARDMISLLERLLSDRWWTRAWTYHEEFCASWKMILLIPDNRHVHTNLEYDFGDVPGEMKLPAVKFREHVTRFCLAHMRKQGQKWQEGSAQCEKLLVVAGQHKMVNQYKKETAENHKTRALTWRVVDDLQRRKLDDNWEILAIIANCCGYSIRLDVETLKGSGCHLSAAVLALVLLNGEVLHNDGKYYLSPDANLFELAARFSFREFGSMVDVREYTYLKRCRFPYVTLCDGGILTKGCIWSLERSFRVPRIEPFYQEKITLDMHRLSKSEFEQIEVLCACISHEYPHLTREIRNFMERVQKEDNDSWCSMVVMARNIVRSIQRGASIAVGSLVGPKDCYGIFIAKDSSNHCFTAYQPRVRSDVLMANRYLEKMISLEVNVQSVDGVPCLSIQRCVAGLTFSEDTDQQQVLLPWPALFAQL